MKRGEVDDEGERRRSWEGGGEERVEEEAEMGGEERKEEYSRVE